MEDKINFVSALLYWIHFQVKCLLPKLQSLPLFPAQLVQLGLEQFSWARTYWLSLSVQTSNGLLNEAVSEPMLWTQAAMESGSPYSQLQAPLGLFRSIPSSLIKHGEESLLQVGFLASTWVHAQTEALWTIPTKKTQTSRNFGFEHLNSRSTWIVEVSGYMALFLPGLVKSHSFKLDVQSFSCKGPDSKHFRPLWSKYYLYSLFLLLFF